MKTWIYSWIVYPLGYALACIVGLFSSKVRDTLRLRSWKDFLSLRFNAGQPIEYWIHVASQGELEYAIPILQELNRLQKKVLVTYYSISAKNSVEQLPKTFQNVSLVVPLPHDGLGLMKDFVALVRAQGVRFLLLMKYELWPGLLWECNAQGVRILLVDALRPSWFHRRLLHKLDGILSGYESEVQNINHGNSQVVGDTRVERVLQRVSESAGRLSETISPALKHLLANGQTLVCGSMWPSDTTLLSEGLNAHKRSGKSLPNVVWVPHELEKSQEAVAKKVFEKLGYAVFDIEQKLHSGGLPLRPTAIIVMKKGLLAELYKLGSAAFVGGGFGSGVHSVWEPAIAGVRVACGPETERSPESTELAAQGLLVRVERGVEFAQWLSGLEAPMETQERLEKILPRHLGAARRVVEFCESRYGKAGAGKASKMEIKKGVRS